jgi:acyl carrier protein
MTTSETIRQFIATNFYVPDPSTLKDDSSFLDLGVIDSTGVLEVVAFLEQEFGIAVEDMEIVPENFDSIANLTRFIEGKKGSTA